MIVATLTTLVLLHLGNGSPACDHWIRDTIEADAGDDAQLAEDLNDLPMDICGATAFDRGEEPEAEDM